MYSYHPLSIFLECFFLRKTELREKQVRKLTQILFYTVCFTNLDQGSKVILFESISTTLIASFLVVAGAVAKKWLELKIEPP